MIQKLQLFESPGHDPHYNLALEQHLLETVPEGVCVLYLWQNQNTVVIGRNQNAWKECRVTRLEEDGGTLARRLSGGGAVFHDLGNLNFTFLLPTAEYDLSRQMQVILTACLALGIPAELSGRNDLTAQGRKFSGNAFYHNRGRSYHHGTLLVSVDKEKMGRYLNPSPAKLQAKGVDSVRARVVNLEELCPGLTIPALKAQLALAFGQVYGLPVERLGLQGLDMAAVERIYAHNRSWEWNFGPQLPFDFSCEARFPWGILRLELRVEGGAIQSCAVWTDAMDWALPGPVVQALTGCRFVLGEMQQRLRQADIPQGEDICWLLAQQDI